MQKTILIVEDDESLTDFLRKTLTDHNFNVLVADDGAEALEMVEKKLPDLVILDLDLAKVSGETVCVEIKKNHPEIVVIVLTAQSKSADAAHILRIGANDYMSKPFTVEELLARIETRFKSAEEKLQTKETVSDGANRITFRESIVLIAIRLIAAEILFAILFLVSLTITSYLGKFFILDNPFYFYLAFIGGLALLDVVIIFSIVLKWYFEYTDITRTAIIKHRGILYRKEQTFACNFIETITLNQDFMGMIFNYGTLELFDPALKEPIYLYNIASPKRYSDVIKKIFSKKKDSSAAIFIPKEIASGEV